MGNPLVSIIVPNFNHARYLRQRIDSILAQDFTDYELLLMDDCSTDDSRSILQEYAGRHGARLLLNQTNSGSTFRQWDKGIQASVGKYIWLAESDDFAAPQLLTRLAGLLETHPRAGIAYCQSNVVDSDGKILSTTHGSFPGIGDRAHWNQDFVRDGRAECADYLVQYNVIPNASAVVFRRDTYATAGGVDQTMAVCGDWKLWAQMLLESDLAHITEPLNFFRTHAQNVRSTIRVWRGIVETMSVIDSIQSNVTVDRRILSAARGNVAQTWIRAWLHRKSAERDIRREAFANIKDLDPAFGWRVARAAIAMGGTVFKNGRAFSWIPRLLKRI